MQANKNKNHAVRMQDRLQDFGKLTIQIYLLRLLNDFKRRNCIPYIFWCRIYKSSMWMQITFPFIILSAIVTSFGKVVVWIGSPPCGVGPTIWRARSRDPVSFSWCRVVRRVSGWEIVPPLCSSWGVVDTSGGRVGPRTILPIIDMG